MKRKVLFPILLFLSFSSFSQQTIGLFLNDSLSQNGYTLFTRGMMTYLIDNCGFEVHSWESEFTSNTSVYLLENGNLLRTCRIPGNPFNGGGIAGRIELASWDNELLWAYDYASEDYHHHHDIEPMPNGNLLILAWDRYSKEEAEAIGRIPNTVDNVGIWPEKIVEVEMVGTDEINVVWEWKLWDHLVQQFNPAVDNFGIISDHPELVDINANTTPGGTSAGESADWIHANAISYNAELDQIAISSRSMSEIWIIDHSTTTEEAASHVGGNSGKGGDLLYRFGNPEKYDRGTEADQVFYGQHNVIWLPDYHPQGGQMMVFNNGQNRFPNGDDYSTIDIWQPPVDGDGNYILEPDEPFGPTEMSWTYSDIPDFNSANVSGAHGLPNGNIFICEGREGHVFEVTQSGEVVWDYVSPVTANGPIEQGVEPSNNALFRATRYTTDYPAFEGRDLTPGAPLELNPWASDCEIFDNPVVSVEEETNLDRVWLRQNPISEHLTVENASGHPIRIQVSDSMGRIVFHSNFVEQHVSINSAQWPVGMYVLRISDENGRRGFSEKVLKF